MSGYSKLFAIAYNYEDPCLFDFEDMKTKQFPGADLPENLEGAKVCILNGLLTVFGGRPSKYKTDLNNSFSKI